MSYSLHPLDNYKVAFAAQQLRKILLKKSNPTQTAVYQFIKPQGVLHFFSDPHAPCYSLLSKQIINCWSRTTACLPPILWLQEID